MTLIDVTSCRDIVARRAAPRDAAPHHSTRLPPETRARAADPERSPAVTGRASDGGGPARLEPLRKLGSRRSLRPAPPGRALPQRRDEDDGPHGGPRRPHVRRRPEARAPRPAAAG